MSSKSKLEKWELPGKKEYFNNLLRRRLSGVYGWNVYPYKKDGYYVFNLYGTEWVKFHPDLEEIEVQDKYSYQGGNEIKKEWVDINLVKEVISKHKFKFEHTTLKNDEYSDLKLGVKRVTPKDKEIINKYRNAKKYGDTNK